MNKSILIIDDNEAFCRSLARMLGDERISVHSSFSSKQAFCLLKKTLVHLVLLDVRLGDESGLEVLSLLQKQYPNLPVIMLTGYASIESAVQSIKLGAFDYIQKPVKYEKLMKLIDNACTIASLKKENRDLHESLDHLRPKILSQDPRVNEIKNTINKLTAANLPILLYGENGTGKELFADYIHFQSSRKVRKIIKINCAAFADTLLDNELFGHEKGAYTGADSLYQGVFEKADQGSLFLDEIGDMSLEVQAKVLRVIQNKELFRLGGKEVIHVDVRLISATNKKLEVLIREGRFREDLYYRLNAATVSIPPLRERPNDIPLLTDLFLKEFASENNKVLKGIDPDVMDQLKKYPWPGNIRELKNVINYAAAVSSTGTLGIRDLPGSLQHGVPGRTGLLNTLDDSEKSIILNELKKTNYNKKKVAEILNISRTTLYSKMRKYEIL
ncbi:sigma-54-dependent Fis family transcriptional regulator [Oceanispirochaeta crateris]|uniref:Sigma-54-dependent Fis family transcriptional regulator n=1 Tax=Oceanispirochaeta crateris TaxID=2518645 RepID=A0A5C1QNL7_9SPIO|nr:sigma-54 dependent transcriptional regulator [Oceanispirochaeta crateris]QEN09553.1 sigma-54-dependent Fis family transcriptional regulator [Oceanispirochaeta crateris]